MSAAPAGWYDEKDPRFVRYWDGQAWTEHVQLKQSPPGDRGSRPSDTRGSAAPQTRRAARAAEQSPRSVIPAAQDKPVEKLSKREARERLRAA